eukprot:5497711-Amphidinium_carterae.1
MTTWHCRALRIGNLRPISPVALEVQLLVAKACEVKLQKSSCYVPCNGFEGTFLDAGSVNHGEERTETQGKGKCQSNIAISALRRTKIGNGVGRLICQDMCAPSEPLLHGLRPLAGERGLVSVLIYECRRVRAHSIIPLRPPMALQAAQTDLFKHHSQTMTSNVWCLTGD